jgi:hypothetical protein
MVAAQIDAPRIEIEVVRVRIESYLCSREHMRSANESGPVLRIGAKAIVLEIAAEMAKNTKQNGRSQAPPANTSCARTGRGTLKGPENRPGSSMRRERVAAGEPNQDLHPGGRDPKGRWSAGNEGHLTHGLFSKRMQLMLMQTREALGMERGQIEIDLGGADQLSAISRGLISRYVEAAAIATALGTRLMTEGAATNKGRTRPILSAYFAAVDRQLRIGLALGLQRRARTTSPAEWLASLTNEDRDDDQQAATESTDTDQTHEHDQDADGQR